MSTKTTRTNGNYYTYGSAALARERATNVIAYDRGRKEIQVMDLKPNKRKPNTQNGWIQYQKYVKVRNNLHISLAVTVGVIVAAAMGMCITLIRQHNEEMVILESYDYEFQRANQTQEKLDTANQAIVILQNTNNQLEYDNARLMESLSDSANVINSLTMELDAANAYIDTAIVAPSSKVYTPTTDLGVSDIMTVDRMNRIIDYWISRNGATDSPFIGRGEAFIKASQESGLDPIFIFALSAHESDFGRTRIARDKFNYMGIGAFDSTPYTSATQLSDNVEGGLIAGAKWVADRYYNQGQNTLYEMIYGAKLYSTSRDAWINGINSIMKVSATID